MEQKYRKRYALSLGKLGWTPAFNQVFLSTGQVGAKGPTSSLTNEARPMLAVLAIQ